MNNKILITIAVVLIVGFLGAVFLLLRAPSQNPGSSNATAGTGLGDQETAKLRNFIDNYLSLYNTYSTGDYSNLYAVGSFSTEDFQVSIIQTISGLESSTPENFERRTTADPKSLTYTLRNTGTTMTATMKGNVTEILSNKQTTYSVTATFELVRKNNLWLVSNVTMKAN